MVRTRTERGTAATDRRPRIGEAIARATPHAVQHGVAAFTGHGPINFRVTDIRVDAAGGHTFALDLAARPLALHGDQVTADTGRCRNVWRPVPHLPHPWQTTPSTDRHQHDEGNSR